MTALLRPTHAPRRGNDGGTRPPLRVVARPAPASTRLPRTRRRLGVVGGGLLFAAVLAGNVAVQAQTTQGQFELERLQATARERQARYQQLRLQVAELEAPRRIVERARQFGMTEPAEVTYLTPTIQTSAGDPGTGTGTGRGAAPAPSDEAAQGWASVKPLLDSR